MYRYLHRFLVATLAVGLGSFFWLSLERTASPAQQAQKSEAEKGKAKPEPIDQAKREPIDLKKARAIELEWEKILPLAINGDSSQVLRQPAKPLEPQWKPHVIIAGDQDNFNYDPGKDAAQPCCIPIKTKTRNFDEPGINKPFAQRVQIPCCKILAIRCEVRVRIEGELWDNDRLYIAIPGNPCKTVWYSDIAKIDPSWPKGKPGQAFTLTWWLPPGVIKQINQYIFESPGCDCHLCLLSQDDHAVNYWQLSIYYCPHPH